MVGLFKGEGVGVGVQAAFEERLSGMPLAVPQMCCALRLLERKTKRQVIIAGRRGGEDTKALVGAAWKQFQPNRMVGMGIWGCGDLGS